MTDTTPSATDSTLTGTDGTSVVVHRWSPDGPPRGVVVVAHGMGEHLLRYAHLARTLTDAGFVVVGPDHRGHGATATAAGAELGALGPDGWTGLIEDLRVLIDQVHDEFPEQPVVLFGHSMGSFAAQQFLARYSDTITALALSGTAAIDPLAETVGGGAGGVDLTSFNAAFEPARTEYDWLSRDPDQVDAYIADPLAGFGIDAASTEAMFAGALALAEPDAFAGVRSSFPVYLAVGEQDPVNGRLALVRLLVDRLTAAGLTDVTLTVWPGARHEILNETNRPEVEADLLAWLDRVIPA